MEIGRDYFLGFQNHCRWWLWPWNLRPLAPWEKKNMTNIDKVLKSRDITLPTMVCIVKTMVFPVVRYGCESWTIKKAESRRIDTFVMWCWRTLLRVLWTARRSNQSILKEIGPQCSLERLTNAEAEAPVLWSPDAKSLLIGKDPDDGKDRRQEEKGIGKDEMVGWHHQLNGYDFGWAPGDGEGQGGLACSVHGVAKSQTWLSDWTTRDNLKCVGGCVSVTCKYYAILYKGIEHPWILLLTGSPWTYPPLIPRNNCNVFHDSDVTPKIVQMRRICVDN